MQNTGIERSQQRCKPLIRGLFTTAGTVGLSVLALAPAAAQLRPQRPDFFERGQEQIEQEINSLIQGQPGSLPILQIEQSRAQWFPMLLREGGGTVLMPLGAVSQAVQRVSSVDGDIDFNVISSTSSLGRFVVAFSDSVASFGQADPNELLERVQRRIIGDQTGFGARGDRTITFKGNPGREFVLSNQEEIISFRVLVVRDRLYVLAVSQPANSPHNVVIPTFFISFQDL